MDPWKPFLRQLLIVSGIWTGYFMFGLCMGSPTVLIPQMRRDANSSEIISEEMSSWLAAAHVYSGIVWVIVLCILAEYIGRKPTYILVSICSLCGFLVFYCSVSVTQILISEIIQGIPVASQISVSVLVSAEYTTPKYRGVFLSMKVASFFWGVWVANAIGTFVNWKKIGALGMFCSVYNCVIVVFSWPESPYWLASKQRFEDCSVSHRWLKGIGEESEKELVSLISSQRAIVKDVSRDKRYTLKRLKDIAFSKEFYKPIFLSVLMLGLYHFSGKIVCSLYIIDIVKKITDSESAAYTGMLLLDGITVFSMYVGAGLSKILKRRTLLLTSSSIAIVFLFIISFYLYMIDLDLIVENKYISIALLSIYSLAISCGPVIICTSVYCEIVSLRYRSSSLIIIGLSGHILMATLLKIAPLIFRTFKLHGVFLLFGISTLVCIVLLYKYLPETKDKTLQEIQDCIKGVDSKVDEIKELMETSKS